MKSLKLLGISFLALALNSCSMNNLLVYKEDPITHQQARENLKEAGWKYVKAKKYTEAEIAFASVNELDGLSHLATIYLEENRPECAINIYRYLEGCDYPVKPCKSALEELAKIGYKPKD